MGIARRIDCTDEELLVELARGETAVSLAGRFGVTPNAVRRRLRQVRRSFASGGTPAENGMAVGVVFTVSAKGLCRGEGL